MITADVGNYLFFSMDAQKLSERFFHASVQFENVC